MQWSTFCLCYYVIFVKCRHAISVQVFQHGLLSVFHAQLGLTAQRLDLQHYVEKENTQLLEMALVKFVLLDMFALHLQNFLR